MGMVKGLWSDLLFVGLDFLTITLLAISTMIGGAESQ